MFAKIVVLSGITQASASGVGLILYYLGYLPGSEMLFVSGILVGAFIIGFGAGMPSKVKRQEELEEPEVQEDEVVTPA